MKEWLLGFLAITLFERRKIDDEKCIPCDVNRRRITAKQSQQMLKDSIDRFANTVEKQSK